MSKYVHPEDRDRVLANIESASNDGLPYTIDYRIVRPDGAEREVVSNGRPTCDADGRVVRLSGTLQDVTESNSAARELARVNADLRRANELNSDVIAMLGHDIRTPISAVRGYLELLEEDWDSSSDQEKRDLVRRARASTTRLTSMVDRILALAAIDSGTIQAHTELLDLPEALAEIATGSGLPSPPDLLVSPGTPRACAFDRVHLEQIVGNLLVNAHRYGAEPIALELGQDPSGGVAIAVTDGGTGIAPEAESTLFLRFARTGSEQVAARGSGFGLYMSAQLAAANGARLTYRRSTPTTPHAFVLSIAAAAAPAEP